jgi:hypothetical protein
MTRQLIGCPPNGSRITSSPTVTPKRVRWQDSRAEKAVFTCRRRRRGGSVDSRSLPCERLRSRDDRSEFWAIHDAPYDESPSSQHRRARGQTIGVSSDFRFGQVPIEKSLQLLHGFDGPGEFPPSSKRGFVATRYNSLYLGVTKRDPPTLKYIQDRPRALLLSPPRLTEPLAFDSADLLAFRGRCGAGG